MEAEDVTSQNDANSVLSAAFTHSHGQAKVSKWSGAYFMCAARFSDSWVGDFIIINTGSTAGEAKKKTGIHDIPTHLLLPPHRIHTQREQHDLGDLSCKAADTNIPNFPASKKR